MTSSERSSAFVLDPSVAYLNHGSYGATPRRVVEAQQALQWELEAQPMAFMASLSGRLRSVMARVATTLGAPEHDIVFVDNASTGVSAVLRSVCLGPGDVVLTTSHAYAAVRRALDFVAAQTGCTVRVADVPWPLDGPEAVEEAVRGAWSPEVVLAVLDHVASVSAVRFPLESLVPWLQARGTRVLVDGAHVPGQWPLHLGNLGADWYTGNLHKWAFTPKGCAVLYARPEAQAGLAPLVLSHGLFEGFAASFELQGTRDPSPWLAADAAWDFVEAQGGFDVIQAHNNAFAHRAADRIAAAVGGRRLAPAAMCASMVSVSLPSVHATLQATQALVNALLARHRVQTWIMPLQGIAGLRVSGQLYSRDEDVERLVVALAAEGVGAPT